MGKFKKKNPKNNKDECWSKHNSSNIKYPETLQSVFFVKLK